MGKTRQKTHSEIEHLRSENRQLRKRLKTLQKQKHFYDKIIDEVVEEEQPESKMRPCSDCGKGFMEEFEILGKIFGTCSTCGFRERIS